MACLASSAWFLPKTGLIEVRGVLGGPDVNADKLISSAEGAGLSESAALPASANATLLDLTSSAGTGGQGAGSLSPSAIENGAALQDLGSPIGPSFDRGGMISYTVQPGDTLSRIAAYFGISIGTIVSANPGLKANLLHAGETLNILPTTGVIYTTQTGDTLQSISNNFGIPQDKIRQFNATVNFAQLDPGVSVIIPGGKNAMTATAAASGLPNFNHSFIMPTDGYNWGILHHYNAVDIANSCGTPVVAAAEGLVIPDPNIPDTTDAWNEGYGNFVLVEHPFGNNVETRYAHLEKVLVQPGDYVEQGEEIGLMGQTGDATGCHLHFEVIGAQNPFAKK